MPKKFKRGRPAAGSVRNLQDLVHEEIKLERTALRNEFGEYTTHNLLNGEVELVADNGDEFRCYLIFDDTESRLVVDDYHPDADADIEVDDFGFLLDPTEEI